MECEYFDKIKDYGHLLAETKYWMILLAPDQRNLGTCVVALKREEPELSGLKIEEWSELFYVMKSLELAVKKAFCATMFNWGCLMNSSYLENPPNPHLHWHFIPRYRKPVEFHGKRFDDPCFGRSTMHNRGKPVKLPNDFKEKIKNSILEYLEL